MASGPLKRSVPARPNGRASHSKSNPPKRICAMMSLTGSSNAAAVTSAWARTQMTESKAAANAVRLMACCARWCSMDAAFPSSAAFGADRADEVSFRMELLACEGWLPTAVVARALHVTASRVLETTLRAQHLFLTTEDRRWLRGRPRRSAGESRRARGKDPD